MRIAAYNLFIFVYSIAAWLISPFNAKAKKFFKGRKGLLEGIKVAFSQNRQPVAWFHCASLGEFEQGKPMMEAYRKHHPDHQILVTFFSPSGYEQRKNTEAADYVFYLPMDTRANASRFLDIVQPVVVFFVKYEFWYHYLNTINNRNIPLYNVSGLFTPRHAFFKPRAHFQRKMLSFFNHFFVQDQQSNDLLRGIGIENVTVSGDTRFDRVLQTISNPDHYEEVIKFKGDSTLVIIGSCWPEDMDVLFDFINTSDSGVKFLVVPHSIEDSNVRNLEKGLTVNSSRWTDERQDKTSDKVLIINTIGMLSSLYQYGDLAYIGGAFRDGVHNILEAVAFGLPVIFGNKNLDKFPETLELMELGGAFSIADKNEASDILNELVNDVQSREKASEICKRYVKDKTGATDIIIKHISQQ